MIVDDAFEIKLALEITGKPSQIDAILTDITRVLERAADRVRWTYDPWGRSR